MTLAVFMLIPSDIETLIDFFSFAAWMFYAVVFCALIYLRWKAPNAPRPYKVKRGDGEGRGEGKGGGGGREGEERKIEWGL